MSISFENYQSDSLRTLNPHLLPIEALNMAALKLNGEAGEVAEIVGKHIYHGHSLNREDLAKEIGDCLWYISIIAHLLKVPLEEIARMNIEKLKKRYPEKFSSELSINRKG